MIFTLKELIKRKGLTQRSVAQKIGISENSINQWIIKRSYPSIENIVKLAIILEIDLKTLFFAMGIDVSGLPEDRNVSIPIDNQNTEVITSIKTIIKTLNVDLESLID